MSIFNWTDEEILAIYKALKDPEQFKFILEAFGMTENNFKAVTPPKYRQLKPEIKKVNSGYLPKIPGENPKLNPS